MTVSEFEFILKDGRKALVRNPKEEDIQEMLDYLKTVSGETVFLMSYPEEIAKYTYESEKQLFERVNASDNEEMLVCLVDGRIAGNCMITFNNKIKTRHRANVAIALLKEFWNLGIGTRLFSEMISIAREKGYVTQLELDFIQGNNRAKALYEKMGFRITGEKPNAIRLKDGTMLSEFSMIKVLQ